MYKKILVVVDDRAVSQSAIRQAIEVAQGFRADIHFFYLLPTYPVVGFEFLPLAELASDDFQNRAIARAQEVLSDALKLAEDAGIQSFGTRSAGADGAKSVIGAALAKHCKLIVVGADDSSVLLHILNDGIVPKLISQSAVPVLVCRETGPNEACTRRSAVSFRSKQRRLELMERRGKEKND